jgi:hypothetical protein
VNKAYAATLNRIAMQGSKGLLTGPIAEKIVAKVTTGTLPSTMTLADLAAYKPRKTQGLCMPYRTHIICTPQAPRAASRFRKRWPAGAHRHCHAQCAGPQGLAGNRTGEPSGLCRP